MTRKSNSKILFGNLRKLRAKYGSPFAENRIAYKPVILDLETVQYFWRKSIVKTEKDLVSLAYERSKQRIHEMHVDTEYSGEICSEDLSFLVLIVEIVALVICLMPLNILFK